MKIAVGPTCQPPFSLLCFARAARHASPRRRRRSSFHASMILDPRASLSVLSRPLPLSALARLPFPAPNPNPSRHCRRRKLCSPLPPPIHLLR
jgi:hypothetical protein